MTTTSDSKNSLFLIDLKSLVGKTIKKVNYQCVILETSISKTVFEDRYLKIEFTDNTKVVLKGTPCTAEHGEEKRYDETDSIAVIPFVPPTQYYKDLPPEYEYSPEAYFMEH